MNDYLVWLCIIAMYNWMTQCGCELIVFCVAQCGVAIWFSIRILCILSCSVCWELIVICLSQCGEKKHLRSSVWWDNTIWSIRRINIEVGYDILTQLSVVKTKYIKINSVICYLRSSVWWVRTNITQCCEKEHLRNSVWWELM